MLTSSQSSLANAKAMKVTAVTANKGYCGTNGYITKAFDRHANRIAANVKAAEKMLIVVFMKTRSFHVSAHDRTITFRLEQPVIYDDADCDDEDNIVSSYDSTSYEETNSTLHTDDDGMSAWFNHCGLLVIITIPKCEDGTVDEEGEVGVSIGYRVPVV